MAVTRHDEGVARHARYYALNAHPNRRAFRKEPVEFVDEVGREYRVDRSGFGAEAGVVKLFVNLPRRSVPWYTAEPGESVVLLSNAAAAPHRVHIESSFRMRGHATGHVLVSASEWPPA